MFTFLIDVGLAAIGFSVCGLLIFAVLFGLGRLLASAADGVLWVLIRAPQVVVLSVVVGGGFLLARWLKVPGW